MSVRQYIGARYVTKIYENSNDPSSAEWEAGVNYEPLVMVTYNNGSYLSKQTVPASIGDPANNPAYWVQTGFYNGQIASLQQQINVLSTSQHQLFLNAAELGCIGDGLTNNYDVLFDIMHNIANSDYDSCTLYFPKGKYMVNDSIFIPSNVKIFGAGNDTEMYYTGEYNYYAGFFIVAGDNVEISNMKFNHAENSAIIISGSMNCDIGISGSKFVEWTTKHMQVDLTKENRNNVYIHDILSDSNYVVQAETDAADFNNITYEKIIAPRAKISVQCSQPYHINNVLFKDIVASFVGTIGSQSGTTNCAIMDNVKCHLMANTAELAIINNCIVDTSNNNIDNGVQSAAYWAGAGNDIFVSNSVFKGDHANQICYILTRDGSVTHLNNVDFGSDYVYTYYSTTPTDVTLFACNCDFKGREVAAMYGGAVNCNGTFTHYSPFVDKSFDFDFIDLEWTANASGSGTEVTDNITLLAGLYLVEVAYPTVSASNMYTYLKNVSQDSFNMTGGTGSRSMHILKLTGGTNIALVTSSAGFTFSNLTRGYVRIVRLS